MPSSPEDHLLGHVRTYNRKTSVVFRRTREEFGGLSNMAAGFPLEINGIKVRTSEALYQACRFPHRPELQRHIINQRSPMTAKMVGKPYARDSRRDWDHVRVKIMRWCLRVKLAQNWAAFGELLLATGDRPIVEDSRRDGFWGTVRVESDTLSGMNVLGRLLMELREQLRNHSEPLMQVDPPSLSAFLLDGQPIGRVTRVSAGRSGAMTRSAAALGGHGVQPSMFDEDPSRPTAR